MDHKRRKRFSSAHPIALIALVVALAGGAYAATSAPKNSVTSKSVKNESLTGKDVKNDRIAGADVDESSLGEVPSATTAESVPDGSITGTKIAANAITGAKVADDSLGGADIDESTLALPPTKFFNVRRLAGDTAFFQFLDLGGFQLDLKCSNLGAPSLFFTQPGGFGVENEVGTAGVFIRSGSLDHAGAGIPTPSNGVIAWTYDWHADESTVVSISLAVVSDDLTVNTDCVVYGSATLQET